MITEALKEVVEGRSLSPEVAEEVMNEILTGKATAVQVASFLTALRMKGESVEEIASMARVLRRHAVRIKPEVGGPIIDVVGTGGDAVKTFNVSTVAAFIVAASGVYVAKHGNRAVTSKCGSADLLERLGVNITAEPEVMKKAIESVGIGFLFAPLYHPAMKAVAQIRREMGIRTVFNILGPLSNPATPELHLIGVYTQDLTKSLAHVLNLLGNRNAMVVHGLDGVDEVSVSGPTKVAHLVEGEVKESTITPSDFGVEKAGIEELQVRDAEHSVEVSARILSGRVDVKEPMARMAIVNAAAALVVAGRCDSFREAAEMARELILSGKPFEKLRALVKATKGDMARLEEVERRYL